MNGQNGESEKSAVAVGSSSRQRLEEARALVNRLHAERGAAVEQARVSRIASGYGSANFQMDWKHVENLTERIASAEAALERELEADASLPQAGMETPVKRAASAAMDLCEMIGKLDAGDAWKVMEVMKNVMAVQLLVLEQKKAVAHG